jgi:hypothetical protein
VVCGVAVGLPAGPGDGAERGPFDAGGGQRRELTPASEEVAGVADVPGGGLTLGVRGEGRESLGGDEGFDGEPLGGAEVPADDDASGGEGVDQRAAGGGDLRAEIGRTIGTALVACLLLRRRSKGQGTGRGAVTNGVTNLVDLR